MKKSRFSRLKEDLRKNVLIKNTSFWPNGLSKKQSMVRQDEVDKLIRENEKLDKLLKRMSILGEWEMYDRSRTIRKRSQESIETLEREKRLDYLLSRIGIKIGASDAKPADSSSQRKSRDFESQTTSKLDKKMDESVVVTTKKKYGMPPLFHAPYVPYLPTSAFKNITKSNKDSTTLTHNFQADTRKPIGLQTLDMTNPEFYQMVQKKLESIRKEQEINEKLERALKNLSLTESD